MNPAAPREAAAPHILARFPHPEPPRRAKAPVLPVFLPFAGCPGRCVFCDQTAQTGASPRPLQAIYAELASRLAAVPPVLPSAEGLPGPTTTDCHNPPASASPQPGPRPLELAFYGGTFTALPDPWPERFLELAAPLLADGRLSRVRCSTRPDAVEPGQLARLKGLGLSLVELGVQSFDDGALLASRRGYDGAAALAGCEAVLAAGLGLGVQLLPGLPGQNAQAFAADMARTAALRPELARLYPCLVLEGTELAERWRSGVYAPWGLDETVEALAQALLTLWAAGIPAARLGLAEQEGLTVLAGPRHPALGQMARGLALLRFVRQRLAGVDGKPARLLLPCRLQGEALGQRNALAADYAALGLAVDFWDEADMALCAD